MDNDDSQTISQLRLHTCLILYWLSHYRRSLLVILGGIPLEWEASGNVVDESKYLGPKGEHFIDRFG